MRQRQKHLPRRRGFSMVEMLTVVAIISIMAVLIGVGLSGGNESVSLGNGQRIAASIFQSARSIAVLRQTQTRVLIYGDQGSGTNGTDPRKFLRFMGVVYLIDNGDENDPDDWIPANQGTYLPEGVFFMPNSLPTGGGGSVTAPSGTEVAKNQSDTDDLKFPNAQASSTENFYYYGFDSNGMSENPGDTFVLNAGRVASEGGGSVTIEVENPNTAIGFAIRRIGGVTLMNDYEEIAKANE